MTMKTEPFLSGKWGWDLGEGDWKDGADENFLKFSYMLNGNVDGFVSSLPSSPSNGTAYFLTTNNTLNARVDGVWYSFPTPKGFTVTEKATGAKYEFTGSAFVSTFNYTDKVKFNSIASGATVNSTDASLRDRTTHTGVQAISTVTGLQTALDAKAPSNSPTFTGTPTAPTVVTSDNSTKLATTAWVKSLGYATSSAVTTVAGRVGDVVLTKTDVGLTNVDNTADTAKPVSTAQQNALDLKLNINNPTLTGTVTLPSTTSIGSVSSVEIGYLDGVSSPIQAQIDSITGVSGGYAPINNPTFTGTVSGITKSMVGLGNVDNTTDVSKPISTLTQAALNAKQATLSGTGFVKSTGGTISYDTNSYASTASPTFTGNVTLPSTTTIGTVTGTQLGYLVNTTSDIQAQINSKAPLTSPTFQSAVTVNAVSGQSSINFSQASVVNGRIYAGGGGGTDIIIDSGRFVTMNPMTNFIVKFNNVTAYDFSPTSFTLPASGRITGDFSNTTNTSRVLVQSSTTNGVTRFDVIPNGTATTATVGAFNNSDPTNASWGRLTATASDVRVESTVSGTGTALPLNLYAGGSQRVSVLANGNILVNTSTDSGYKFDVNGTARVTGVLTTTSKILSRFNAGATPIYTAGQLELNNAASGNPVALGFHAEGSSACQLVHLNGGNGLELYGTAYGTYANFKAATITANTGFTGDGANISGINAANISAGTLSGSRLPFAYTTSSSANAVVQRDGSGDIYIRNTVSSGDIYCGSNGIYETITTNAQNGVWRIASNANYGISYFHGTSGNGSQDTIGFHFGTPTAAGSSFQFRQDGYLFATAFVGNGVNLTNLNAASLTGTVPTSTLPVASTSAVGVSQLGDGTGAPSSSKAATELWVYGINQSIGSSIAATAATLITKAKPSQNTQVITHSSAGTLTINLSSGTDIQINVSANITGITFTNAPNTTDAWSATLEFVVSGTRTIVWPTGSRAAGGTLPTLTASGTDVFVIRKRETDNYMIFTSGKAIA